MTRPNQIGSRSFSAKHKHLLASVVLAVLVGWSFLPSLRNGFVDYDDQFYVTANPHVQQGLTWAGVGWSFRSGEASNWHPLTWLSHCLDCQLFGLRPWGHHLTSLALHVLNTVLLFMVLSRMTGAAGRSFLVAALFGVHPLHVESVAWVAERKDVLSALFWLLTMWAYAVYGEESKVERPKFNAPFPIGYGEWPLFTLLATKRNVFYGLALLAFALGLTSKPMLVSLPCVLLLLDCWPLRSFQWRSWQRLCLEKTPFFLLSAVSCGITFAVQKAGGAVMVDIPLATRLGNAAMSYGRYLGKLFYPAGLCAFYPYPASWPAGWILASVLLVGGVSIVAIRARRALPVLFTGWFWFIVTLIPVIGLVQVGEQSMADRYGYIPSIGVFILVAWGAGELASRWKRGPAAFSVASAAAIAICALLTRRQIGFWHDGETLFLRAIAVTEGNGVAHDSLGTILASKGRLDEAIAHYREALKLRQDDASALNNLGSALILEDRYTEAVQALRQALKAKPGYPKAHYNLGTALAKEGRLDEAVRELRMAVTLAPEAADYHSNLGGDTVLSGALRRGFD